MAGLFITFEGVEGAGKSTQIEKLRQHFEALGQDVVVTREPGGTSGAEKLRDLLVKGGTHSWSPLAECLLMNAARSDHLTTLIRPALEEEKIVLCDRFMDSTRAYQGHAGRVDMADLLAIEKSVVDGTMPDLTLVFDLAPETGLARARARGGDDRFERKGIAYHEAVRAAFRKIAEEEPHRCVLIDADRPEEEVAAAVLEALHSKGILL